MEIQLWYTQIYEFHWATSKHGYISICPNITSKTGVHTMSTLWRMKPNKLVASDMPTLKVATSGLSDVLLATLGIFSFQTGILLGKHASQNQELTSSMSPGKDRCLATPIHWFIIPYEATCWEWLANLAIYFHYSVWENHPPHTMEEIRLTSWYGKYPIVYDGLSKYIPGGCFGFLNHQQYHPLSPHLWKVLSLLGGAQ